VGDELHPVVRVVTSLLAVGVFAFSAWCTVIAFAGGTIPIFGSELDGSIGGGFLWMLAVTPIITTIGYWLAIVITLPLGAIFRR
jgi:hypothetical protein